MATGWWMAVTASRMLQTASIASNVSSGAHDFAILLEQDLEDWSGEAHQVSSSQSAFLHYEHC